MRQRALLAAVLVIGFAGVGSTSGAEGADVVAEVVRMLEAGVGEEIVFSWLSREGRPVPPLSADDIIALTRAGASPTLTKHLLDRTATRPAEPAPAETPGPAATPRTPAGLDSGKVSVSFSVHHRTPRDSELDDADDWNLVVYLDGSPVARSDGRNWLSRAKRVREFAHELEPGDHVVRLLREKDERYGSRKRHAARVCPDPIEFRATPGQRLEIDVSDPVGLAGGRRYEWTVADGPGAGETRPLTGPASDWPALCEDLENDLRDGGKLSRRDRKQLERCVTWPELWPGLEVPTRGEVRERLRQQALAAEPRSD